MFENILAEQNRHWNDFLYTQLIDRDVFNGLVEYLSVPHVISVTGVRRAGKSTLLKQAINFLIAEKKVPTKNILFANLEHPYFSQYSNDVRYLERLFEDYLKIAQPEGKIYCLLDEVQFFSNWPVFVKAHYEQKQIKFIVTGSNSFLMSHELLTLLSGRTLPLEIFPLSLAEVIQAKTTIKELSPLVIATHRHEIRGILDLYIRYGGFPEVVLLDDKKLADDILNAYSKTILYQDVATRLNLKKPLDLERLYYYLSSHIGAFFTYSGLAEIFDLTDKTIKEYIEALIGANLLFEVDKFSFSLKQQIRSPKKIFSIDTGIVNAMAFKFSENRGKLFENILFLELKRRKKEIYYYKTTAGYEVDFVTREKNALELIQVCIELHAEAEKREIRALVQAAHELKLSKGILVTAETEKEWVLEEVQITAIPLYKFLFTA